MRLLMKDPTALLRLVALSRPLLVSFELTQGGLGGSEKEFGGLSEGFSKRRSI